MVTNDNAQLLVDECQKPGIKAILAEAIADSLDKVTAKEVKVQRCEQVNRRLDAAARLHSSGRQLNSFFSKVLVSYTLQVVAAKKEFVTQQKLDEASSSVVVAVRNKFKTEPALSSLNPEIPAGAESVRANIVDFDQDGKSITTTSTTSTTLATTTLETNLAVEHAATAGIVAGIIFCVLFICFIIAIVCYMLNHRNSDPNLNQGNQNQPGTDQSESEGDPQATPDIVAGAQPDGGRVQAHIREFQV